MFTRLAREHFFYLKKAEDNRFASEPIVLSFLSAAYFLPRSSIFESRATEGLSS